MTPTSIDRRLKVLLAKPGLDGHDRGVKVVAMALRDAGMEVIYIGRHRTPEQIVASAIHEDVDIIGLSILGGAHLTLCPEVIRLLKQRGAGHILVITGGFIPKEDEPKLKEAGIAEVFGVGTNLDIITNYIKDHVRQD